MVTTPTSILATVVIAVLIMVPQAVTGEDQPAYESLSDVTIGRVFFSPDERKALDNKRVVRPAVTKKLIRNSPPRAQRKRESDAAGYIVSSSGKSHVYSNGDFVAGDAQKTMEFPGHVNIVRRTIRRSSSDHSDAPESGPSDASK